MIPDERGEQKLRALFCYCSFMFLFCFISMPTKYQCFAAAIEEGKKHLDRKVPSQGIFRPESPYIPGTRKITKKEEPIELKSISPTLEDLLTTTDRGSLSPTTSPSEVTTAPPLLDQAPPAVLPAALQNSVIVKDLSASWTNNMDELTLKNISFEVNEVHKKIRKHVV